MQCDYCGKEVLWTPISVELEAEAISPDSDLQAGDLYFCSQECHQAYLEEAGVSMNADMEEETSDEEDHAFSDRMRYSL